MAATSTAAGTAGGHNIALVMMGDCMLGRVVDESLTAVPAQLAGVWGDTLPRLQGGMAGEGELQVVAGNLECAVTDSQDKEDKTFNFRLSTANVAALTNARFDFVSLANNHSLDYKAAGLADTLRTLRCAGIAFAGAGTAAEAAAPALVERCGLRLAFLSYADHYDSWAATQHRAGIHYIDPASHREDDVAAELAAARQAGADLVVVFVHWGPNWVWRPSAAIRRLAHTFVDCGADVVFGHSSHHIQGIEVYRQRPIVYGAGGFIDDYRLDEVYRNDLGFLYCCHVSAGVPATLELVPTRIVHTWQPSGHPRYLSEVHTAHGRDARWLRSKLRELCREWGTRIEDGGDGRLCIPLRPGGSPAAAAETAAPASTSSGGGTGRAAGVDRTEAAGGADGCGGDAGQPSLLAKLLGSLVGP